jgi:hypothetical protein
LCSEDALTAKSSVAELVTELNISYTIPLAAEAEASPQPLPPKLDSSLGPSSLAFTIDFGHSDGNYQITDHWTHPTPFRGHSGMQRRTVQSKAQKSTKEPTKKNVDARKLSKVLMFVFT